MEILNTVRDIRRGRPIGIAGRIEPGEKELWEAIEIVANALDLEVGLRLEARERKRATQGRIAASRLNARLTDPNPAAKVRARAVAAADEARRIAFAKEVIDSAALLLEDHAETPSDWGVVEALRDALDTEFGVKRDA